MSGTKGRKVLFLGGARSGKSRLAQMEAEKSGLSPIYLATGVITDPEMAQRVEKHRQARSHKWETIEVPYGLVGLKQSFAGKAVVLDCVTFLVSNLLLKEKEEAATREKIQAELGFLLKKQAKEGFSLFLVSNEVGEGVVPESPLARSFRDLQGQINQWIAQRVDQVFLVVAGIPWKIKG
ncbi:MAG: adenosylcobinamide kinase / adenosylcobinamide-phosphate guanylyltransferase [Candidatus Atribacteria bacterium]|nr:adenosylcobinamide kinase / adenosylcobinamide-phosphate guanylyltransferase [Candidatus Atribacteria bacterium]